MAQTVIGFFDDYSEAQEAVQKLQSSGISNDRIDISRGGSGSSMSGSSSTSDSGSYSGTSSSGGVTTDDKGRNTNRVTDFFNSLFGGGDNDNDEASRYSNVAQNSNSIVTVHAQSSDEAERAADILDDCGAVDVDERAAQYGGSMGSRQGVSNDSDSSNDRGLGNDRDVSNDRDSDTTISRVEENLEVGKRQVEGGGVRVRSRIVERPVEESVRLREEHVRVDRQEVNRPVTDSDRGAFQERDIELTERSEVPVVNKEARVVEEIRISKEVDEHTETIRDTVRNTEVDIDQVGDRDNDKDLYNRNNMNRTDEDNNDLGTSNRGIL